METSSEDFEEEAPLLGGLFSEERVCSNSSDDEEYSGSDREWRDALKAAVETEIQYQVQLRLSLDTPIQRKHRGGKTPTNDTSNNGRNRSIQLNMAGDGDEHLTQVSSPLNLQLPSLGAGGEGEGDEARRCRQEENNLALSSKKVACDAKDENDPIPKSTAKAEKKDPQTVYDYLNQKYGVPYSQLRNLMSGGKLECTKMDKSSVGIDERVCWPTECNIVKSAPDFSLNHSQTNGTPFFPEATPIILGQARPTFHRPKDSCTVVFDRKRDIQIMEDGNGGLTFESRFESGNLQQAIKAGSNEYDLILSTDLYTERHTQWFYFQITAGIEKGASYVFNIINFRKRDSLYNNGMKLLMYSDMNGSWMRVGQNICYRKLPPCNHSPLLKQGINYYYLSWKMEFPHGPDQCTFVHCYPYTYTHLLKTLDSYESDVKRKDHIRREELCKTLAGNTCPVLTITDYRSSQGEWSGRMGVVFSARIHPGETNSSWMMDGVLDYLTSEHKHARYLRSKFVFKIIPMLNPDGVIVGNYRTSLAGVDLNRVFKHPMEKIFPTVYATKTLIQEFNEERKVALYVDLHGHSRSYNVFMYGCHANQCNHQQFLEERAVPWMLSQISKEKFSFKKCKFAVQRCKEATGRVSIWREGIPNSFTMEASFCGTNLTRPTPLHFTSEDLTAVGKDLCEVLLKIHRYNKSNSYRFKVNSAIAEYLLGTIDSEATPPTVLPDLVTSTTGQRGGEDGEGMGGDGRQTNCKRKSRQQMAKILQRFHGVSINQLEMESSTSGSDSEDDDFTYIKGSKSKNRNKHKKHKTHRSSRKQHMQSTLINSQEQKLPKIDTSGHASNADHTPSIGKQHNKGQHHGSVSSAPPRLQGGGSSSSTHVAHGWRFVNKYANRSNGGIPMFSEERSKERAEKKEKLKSLSQIQNSEVVQLPLLGSCSAAVLPPGPPTSTIRPIRGADKSLQLPSLTWKPTDSQREIPLLAPPPRGSGSRADMSSHLESASVGMFIGESMQRRRHSESIGISNQLVHYKNIKKLVEDQKRFTTLQPRPPRSQVGVAGHHAPPSLPPGLPPQLSQYISKIWHKHSGTFL